jgi:hypothetical protein
VRPNPDARPAPGERMCTMSQQTNTEPMQTTGDAWNGRGLDVFAERHKDDVAVR